MTDVMLNSVFIEVSTFSSESYQNLANGKWWEKLIFTEHIRPLRFASLLSPSHVQDPVLRILFYKDPTAYPRMNHLLGSAFTLPRRACLLASALRCWCSSSSVGHLTPYTFQGNITHRHQINCDLHARCAVSSLAPVFSFLWFLVIFPARLVRTSNSALSKLIHYLLVTPSSFHLSLPRSLSEWPHHLPNGPN